MIPVNFSRSLLWRVKFKDVGNFSFYFFLSLKKNRNTDTSQNFAPEKNLNDAPDHLSFECRHFGQLAKVGQRVVEEDATLDAFFGDDCDAAATAGTAVTVDGQRHALLHLQRRKNNNFNLHQNVIGTEIFWSTCHFTTTNFIWHVLNVCRGISLLFLT